MTASPRAATSPPYQRPADRSEAGLTGVAAIGKALEREGDQLEARTLYETALRDGRATSPSDAAQPVRWIARTYIKESALDAARDCAVAALAISEAASDEAGRGHAENLLAIVEWKQSNLDEAERLYRRAHHSAQVAGELRLAAMTASNLGVIASVRGNDAEARRYFETGLANARLAALPDQTIATL